MNSHHPPEPPPPATANKYTAPTNGIAVASVGMGFFSLIVFFWHPFSTVLAAVGFLLGVISLSIGLRGGLRNENLALIGTLICGASLGIVLTLNQFLRYVQWDTFPWNW